MKRCRFGIHKYGKWLNMEWRSPYKQYKKCERCNKLKSRFI